MNNQHIGVFVCVAQVNKQNSGCYYTLGDSSVLSNGEKVGFILNTLNPTYSNQKVGLFNELTTPIDIISDGVYFKLNNLNSNIIGAIKYNGVEYTCDTGISIIGSKWYKVEFEVDTINNIVKYYVNDAETPNCQISGNLPKNKNLGPKATFYSSSAPLVDEYVGMIDTFWISYSAGQRWD